MLKYILLAVVFLAISVSAKKYDCQKCLSDKKDCLVHNDKAVLEHNCDYCVRIIGTVTDVNKVPQMAKDYVKQNFPTFKRNLSHDYCSFVLMHLQVQRIAQTFHIILVKSNQKIYGRGCVTKQVLTSLDFKDTPDCAKFDGEDGFTGDGCTCLGNC